MGMGMGMGMVMDQEDLIMAVVGPGRIRVGIKGLREWDRGWGWEDREV